MKEFALALSAMTASYPRWPMKPPLEPAAIVRSAIQSIALAVWGSFLCGPIPRKGLTPPCGSRVLQRTAPRMRLP